MTGDSGWAQLVAPRLVPQVWPFRFSGNQKTNYKEKKNSWVHKSGDFQRLRVQNFSEPSEPRIIKSPWLQLQFID